MTSCKYHTATTNSNNGVLVCYLAERADQRALIILQSAFTTSMMEPLWDGSVVMLHSLQPGHPARLTAGQKKRRREVKELIAYRNACAAQAASCSHRQSGMWCRASPGLMYWSTVMAEGEMTFIPWNENPSSYRRGEGQRLGERAKFPHTLCAHIWTHMETCPVISAFSMSD